MSKFLLVDDHEVIRTGIKITLQINIVDCIIDEASDRDSALDKIKGMLYDIIILDINIPNTDSFQLLQQILSLSPGSKVLIFSMNDENVYAEKYLKMGAMGYVQKDKPAKLLIEAILKLLNNQRFFSPDIKDKLKGSLENKSEPQNPFDSLSPREFEIAIHLARGSSLSYISHTLQLHTSTVGTHKSRIFQKLQCSNIIELNIMARAHHVIIPS